jgi:hypothetical protein
MSKRQAYHLQPKPLTSWANLNRSPIASYLQKWTSQLLTLAPEKRKQDVFETQQEGRQAQDRNAISNSREADTLAFRLWSKCFPSSASHPDESVPRNYDSYKPGLTAETVNAIKAHTTVAKIQLRWYPTSSYSPVQTLASS